MRTTLFALALLLSHAAAATTFVIGNEPFELEFEANPTNQLFSSRPSQLSVLSPPARLTRTATELIPAFRRNGPLSRSA